LHGIDDGDLDEIPLQIRSVVETLATKLDSQDEWMEVSVDCWIPNRVLRGAPRRGDSYLRDGTVDVTVENRGQQRAEHTLKRPRNAEIGCKTTSASLAVDFLSI